MRHVITLAAAVAALGSCAFSAEAGCAPPTDRLATAAPPKIQGFIVAGMAPKISLPPSGPVTAAKEIVGSWLVTYTAGGKYFAQALIQWHSDGTEWENVNLPIEGGNVCVGSWKAVDDTHVTRFHVGWLYTSGKLSGYFTETETDTVANFNRYTGTNDQKIFDLKGNVLAEVTGTSSAYRFGP